MTVHIKMGLELGKQKKITITNLKAVLQGVITGVGRACLAPSFATRQRWFGTSAGTVVASMTKMKQFVDGCATIYVQYRNDPQGFAYVYSDAMRKSMKYGTFIVYVNDLFFRTIDFTRAENLHMSHQNTLGVQILTLSHELSHLVLGTNASGSPYSIEHYENNALLLVGTNPVYAANNADNFGYCIEECS